MKMYTVELIVGLILSVFGIAVFSYLIYLLATKNYADISILHLSEAFATVLIGIFYMTCAIIISIKTRNEIENDNNNISFVESRNINDIFDSKNFYDANVEVLEENEHFNKSQDILNAFLSNNNMGKFYYNNKLYEGHTKRSLTVEDCDFEEIYLKYAVLVSSFIYGIVSIVNSMIFCKNCKSPIDEKNQEENEKVFVKRSENSTQTESGNLKTAIQAIVSYLVPIIYTIIVYYSMRQNFPDDLLIVEKLPEIKPTASEIMSIIENPMNVTSDNKKVDEIVDKIYNIVSSVRSNLPMEHKPYPPVMYDIINFFNNRTDKSIDLSCDYKNMPLKVHTLLLFILAYFAALFYTKLVHTKLQLSRNSQQNIRMGKYITAFGLLWFPMVMEIFTRTYLMDYQPGLTSDLFLGLGNVTRIVANVFNLLFVKDVIKKHTNVVHTV